MNKSAGLPRWCWFKEELPQLALNMGVVDLFPEHIISFSSRPRLFLSNVAPITPVYYRSPTKRDAEAIPHLQLPCDGKLVGGGLRNQGICLAWSSRQSEARCRNCALALAAAAPGCLLEALALGCSLASSQLVCLCLRQPVCAILLLIAIHLSWLLI